MRRLLIVAAFALAGCQSAKERLFSPVTQRLDLANAQLADGVNEVRKGNARLDAMDAKVAGIDQRVARIEAQLKTTDERVGRMEGQFTTTDKRIAGMQKDVGTATKSVVKVEGLATEMNGTVQAMGKTLGDTHQRIEVMDGRLMDANKKIDDVNKKLDVIVEAASKIPGVKKD